MNYSRHYELLISRAKNRILETYTESHHIIPRCMGGRNDKSNLVDLTPEEHYLAHQLLVKMHPTNVSLAKAASMMTTGRPSNKLYGWLRRRLASAMSETQTGTGNSQYGTRWIHNKKLQKSKKIKKQDLTPDGWCDGYVWKWNKPKKQSKYEMYQKRKESSEVLAKELFERFKQSEYNSICQFALANGTTQPRLCMLWKKYVEEYRNNREHGKPFKNRD